MHQTHFRRIVVPMHQPEVTLDLGREENLAQVDIIGVDSTHALQTVSSASQMRVFEAEPLPAPASVSFVANTVPVTVYLPPHLNRIMSAVVDGFTGVVTVTTQHPHGLHALAANERVFFVGTSRLDSMDRVGPIQQNAHGTYAITGATTFALTVWDGNAILLVNGYVHTLARAGTHLLDLLVAATAASAVPLAYATDARGEAFVLSTTAPNATTVASTTVPFFALLAGRLPRTVAWADMPADAVAIPPGYYPTIGAMQNMLTATLVRGYVPVDMTMTLLWASNTYTIRTPRGPYTRESAVFTLHNALQAVDPTLKAELVGVKLKLSGNGTLIIAHALMGAMLGMPVGAKVTMDGRECVDLSILPTTPTRTIVTSDPAGIKPDTIFVSTAAASAFRARVTSVLGIFPNNVHTIRVSAADSQQLIHGLAVDDVVILRKISNFPATPSDTATFSDQTLQQYTRVVAVDDPATFRVAPVDSDGAFIANDLVAVTPHFGGHAELYFHDWALARPLGFDSKMQTACNTHVADSPYLANWPPFFVVDAKPLDVYEVKNNGASVVPIDQAYATPCGNFSVACIAPQGIVRAVTGDMGLVREPLNYAHEGALVRRIELVIRGPDLQRVDTLARPVTVVVQVAFAERAP